MPSLHDSDTVELVPPAAGRVPPTAHTAGVRADVAGLSHPGKVRGNNEDHYLLCRFGRFLEPLGTNLPADVAPARREDAGYALVVADGMGGAAAGEVASRLAISTLVNLALATPDWILRLDELNGGRTNQRGLPEAEKELVPPSSIMLWIDGISRLFSGGECVLEWVDFGCLDDPND